MMSRNDMHKALVLLWIVVIVMSLGTGHAQRRGPGLVPPGMEDDYDMPQPDRRDRRRDRGDEEAATITAVAKDLEAIKKDLFGMIQEGKQPPAKMLESAETVLRTATRYRRDFESQEQLDYYLDMAWVAYFQEDYERALQASSQGFREYPGNEDAVATHVLMSIVNGKDLRLVQAQIKRMQGQLDSDGYSSRTRSELDFSVDLMDFDLVGRELEAMQLGCVNSTVFPWSPQSGPLAIFFWQLMDKSEPEEDGGSGDPNEPGQVRPEPEPQPQRQRRGYQGYRGYREENEPANQPIAPPGMDPYYQDYGPAMMPPGMGGGREDKPEVSKDLGEEMESFGGYFSEYLGNSGLRFVAVNTDIAANRETVLEQLLAEPKPWANVLAASAGTGAGEFAEIDAQGGILAVADAAGTIRYAGPAKGFLPRMVLEHFAPDSGGVPMPMISGEQMRDFAQQAAERKQEPEQTQPQRQPEESGRMTADDYRAQKLVENADKFIQMGLKFGSPKRGIDMAREVIEKYPNTKYAEQARALLRGLPDRFKRAHNITDEEMGL